MQTGPITVELLFLCLRINVGLDSRIDDIIPDFDNCKLYALQRGNLYSQTSETIDASSTRDKAVEQNIKILGIVGSLRQNSFNKALMNAAIELQPENAEIEVFDIASIPPFNQDNENNQAQIVNDFKAKIKSADALLIATPEYNYSVPGVLKNALDSASRPFADKVFDGKPVALMSASSGKFGGARAQYHLRQSFVYLNMFSINKPEVMLPQAQQYIDENGKITNVETRTLIKQLLEELIKLARKLKEKNQTYRLTS